MIVFQIFEDFYFEFHQNFEKLKFPIFVFVINFSTENKAAQTVRRARQITTLSWMSQTEQNPDLESMKMIEFLKRLN